LSDGSGVDHSTLARILGIEAVGAPEPPAAVPPAGPPPARVLIVGLPRSGSTFLQRALARTAGVSVVEEPDNADRRISACRAVRGQGLQPALRVDDPCPSLAACFAGAFDEATAVDRRRRALAERVAAPSRANRRVRCADTQRPALPWRLRAGMRLAPLRTGSGATATRLVKTVHMALSVDWLLRHTGARAVVTRRHPLDVLASWRSLGINPVRHGWHLLCRDAPEGVAERFGAPPPPTGVLDSTPVVAWVVGLLMSGIEQALHDHPHLVVADHEIICRDPSSEVRHVARQVGLVWTDAAEEFVRASNSPGVGYTTTRVAATLPGSWRDRLEPDEIAEAREVLARFGWAARYDGLA